MDNRDQIYYGEFRSSADVLWRVELWKRSDGTIIEAEELEFSSDPLVIEWNTSDKMKVVEPSSATLTIISPSDRKYIDLYQVEVGAILMNVYRDGELYWSGTLDTELYEEPYSTIDGYEVMLTFSDFSVLSRKIFSTDSSTMTLNAVVNQCLTLSEISYLSVEKLISTNYNGTAISLSNYKVNTENFIDEDGECMNAKDVLAGVLRPFALKIRQKNGKIFIYDLNAIYSNNDSASIYWSSTDANLSTDKAVSDVTLTFSPYSDSKIIEAETQPSDITAETTKTVYLDCNNDNVIGFNLHVASTSANNSLEVSGGAKYFSVEPNNSGSSEAGVIYSAYADTNPSVSVNGLKSPTLCNPELDNPIKIITSHKGYVNKATTGYQLKISLDALFDVRYNPFESASDANNKDAWEKLQNWASICYVGVRIYIEADNGNTSYYYCNRNVYDSIGCDKWGYWTQVERSGQFKDCFLCYYSLDDRHHKSGFGGWQTNKQIIGKYADDLPSAFTRAGGGMTIGLPPVDGNLVIEVSNYIPLEDFNPLMEEDIYSLTRWVAFKNLKAEVVRSDGFAYNNEDVEVRAWLNESAAEGIELTTIVGTMQDPVPTARGVLLDSSRDMVTHNFTRAGKTASLEHLLIGTAYSNYATRHNVLSGEVEIIHDKLIAVDANASGKYWIAGETHSTAEDCGSATFIELKEESYSGIQYNG